MELYQPYRWTKDFAILFPLQNKPVLPQNSARPCPGSGVFTGVQLKLIFDNKNWHKLLMTRFRVTVSLLLPIFHQQQNGRDQTILFPTNTVPAFQMERGVGTISTYGWTKILPGGFALWPAIPTSTSWQL